MRLLTIIAILLTLAACLDDATVSRDICRFNALTQARVVKHDFGLVDSDIRFAYGRTSAGWHVQAQARIDGEWRWLSQVPYRVLVFHSGSTDEWGEVTRYYTVEEFMERIERWRLE